MRVFAVKDKYGEDGADLRFTLTLVTSINPIDQCPCWARITTGANDADNFKTTVFEAVDQGFLRRGDVLVADNSKV